MVKRVWLVFLVFWLTFFIFISLQRPVNRLLCSESLATWTLTTTSNVEGEVYLYLCSDFKPSLALDERQKNLHPKSEHTVEEQLSNFYILLIIFISVYSLRVLSQKNKIRAGICFLMLGLILYLCEINMISNDIQPLMAVLIFPVTLYVLFRVKSWGALVFFLIGVGFLVAGVGADLIKESIMDERFSFPSIFIDFSDFMNSFGEEKLDTIAAAALCFSSIILFFSPLQIFFRNNMKGVIAIVLSIALIAIGNSFLQPGAGNKLLVISYLISLVGWLGIIFSNRYVLKNECKLYIYDQALFSAVCFVLFVFLPPVYKPKNINLVSVMVWVPVLIFIAISLYKTHPSIRMLPQK